MLTNFLHGRIHIHDLVLSNDGTIILFWSDHDVQVRSCWVTDVHYEGRNLAWFAWSWVFQTRAWMLQNVWVPSWRISKLWTFIPLNEWIASIVDSKQTSDSFGCHIKVIVLNCLVVLTLSQLKLANEWKEISLERWLWHGNEPKFSHLTWWHY